MESVGFLRKKSPVWGICVSSFLAFVLFCLLLILFIAQSALSLVTDLDGVLANVLEDEEFRKEASKLIQEYAPEDSVTSRELDSLMEDETISETFGEFAALWMNEIIENGEDPVDALVEALEDPDMSKQYERAINKALKKLDKDDEDFWKASKKLAEKYHFPTPPRYSTNLEIAIAIVEGTREDFYEEIDDVLEYVEDTQEVVQGFSFALPIFGAVLFIVFNLLFAALFYGLFLLLVRHLLKPCLYLGIPYILVGIFMLILGMLDLSSIVGSFAEIPKNFRFLFGMLSDPLLTGGLIAMIIGVLLTGGSTATMLLLKKSKKEPQAATISYSISAEQEEKTSGQTVIANNLSTAESEDQDITEEAEETTEKTVVCPNCGEPIEGTRFCTNCGTKIEE